MGSFFRHNWMFLLLIVTAVVVYAVFVTPWLWETGHPALAVCGFALFGVVTMYGRAVPARRKRYLVNGKSAR